MDDKPLRMGCNIYQLDPSFSNLVLDLVVLNVDVFCLSVEDWVVG